ncbi:MAG: hypothetical protein DI547_05780 [Sphingobium sp.]|nr:MAG: hypothetical protein DI547_05780 [Sphingobium sp.]
MRLTAALMMTAALGVLSSAPAKADPPKRITNLVVYGDDACPQGEDGEIVVCARKPESERYRIPKALREKPEVAGGPGWGAQVANIEAASRQMIPNSCSVIGSYGQGGCVAAMLQQWFAEKRMRESAGVP